MQEQQLQFEAEKLLGNETMSILWVPPIHFEKGFDLGTFQWRTQSRACLRNHMLAQADGEHLR